MRRFNWKMGKLNVFPSLPVTYTDTGDIQWTWKLKLHYDEQEPRAAVHKQVIHTVILLPYSLKQFIGVLVWITQVDLDLFNYKSWAITHARANSQTHTHTHTKATNILRVISCFHLFISSQYHSWLQETYEYWLTTMRWSFRVIGHKLVERSSLISWDSVLRQG